MSKNHKQNAVGIPTVTPKTTATTCENCGSDVDLDDLFNDWFHTDLGDAPLDIQCDPRFPWVSFNIAAPRKTRRPRKATV